MLSVLNGTKFADSEKEHSYHLEGLDTNPNVTTDEERIAIVHGRRVDHMEECCWKSWRFIGKILTISLDFVRGVDRSLCFYCSRT